MEDTEHRMTFVAMDTLSQAVASTMGWDREARLRKILRLWQETFANPIARVSYPSALLDKELVVACASALWKRELTFLLPEIRQKLVDAFPPLSGYAITFRVVRPFSLPRNANEPPFPSPDHIEALWKRAEEISSRLPEPLREKGQRFVFSRLLNGSRLSRKPPEEAPRS